MTPNSTAAPIQNVLLRTALPEDDDFLFQLFAETQDQLWCFLSNQALWNSLVTVQYKGRELTYASQYPQATNSIICVDQGPAGTVAVGRLLIERLDDHWRLVDIALLRAYRHRGIGTRAMQQCLVECKSTTGILKLRVAVDSPAQRLYSRLGFVETVRDSLGIEMLWNGTSLDVLQQSASHQQLARCMPST